MTQPTKEELHRLLRMIADKNCDEMSCEMVTNQVCSYFDAKDRGVPLSPEQQAIERHLDSCPECGELYEALRDACDCRIEDPEQD